MKSDNTVYYYTVKVLDTNDLNIFGYHFLTLYEIIESNTFLIDHKSKLNKSCRSFRVSNLRNWKPILVFA